MTLLSKSIRATPLPLFAAIVPLMAVVASGCGGSGGARAARPAVSPAGAYLHDDGDRDGDERGGKSDEAADYELVGLAAEGRRASARERRAVTALLRRYYGAAAAGQGAVACALLQRGLLATLAASGRGVAGCEAALTPFFRREHRQLVADRPATIHLVELRLKGGLGYAVLGFRTQVEREILVVHEQGAWRVDALGDSSTP